MPAPGEAPQGEPKEEAQEGGRGSEADVDGPGDGVEVLDAAGKLVIATRFPHSIELLSEGGGVLVDHEHPAQIAEAIREALADPARALAAQAVARESARANSWEVVAETYRVLASELASVGVAG